MTPTGTGHCTFRSQPLLRWASGACLFSFHISHLWAGRFQTSPSLSAYLKVTFRFGGVLPGVFLDPAILWLGFRAESFALKYSVGRYNHQTHIQMDLNSACKYTVGRVPVSNRYNHHLAEWNRLRLTRRNAKSTGIFPESEPHY